MKGAITGYEYEERAAVGMSLPKQTHEFHELTLTAALLSDVLEVVGRDLGSTAPCLLQDVFGVAAPLRDVLS